MGVFFLIDRFTDIEIGDYWPVILIVIGAFLVGGSLLRRSGEGN